MKVALITGSEGQLGKAYVNRLLELDYRIIGFVYIQKQHLYQNQIIY